MLTCARTFPCSLMISALSSRPAGPQFNPAFHCCSVTLLMPSCLSGAPCSGHRLSLGAGAEVIAIYLIVLSVSASLTVEEDSAPYTQLLPLPCWTLLRGKVVTDCLIKAVLLASGVEGGGREPGLTRRGGQGRRKERQIEWGLICIIKLRLSGKSEGKGGGPEVRLWRSWWGAEEFWAVKRLRLGSKGLWSLCMGG